MKLDLESLNDCSALNFKQKEFYDTYLLCKTYFDNGEYLRLVLIAIWLSFYDVCLLN